MFYKISECFLMINDNFDQSVSIFSKFFHLSLQLTDINECTRLNGGCNHICEDTDGSFVCKCRPGYRLSSNKRTCDDIDECTENTPCDQNNGVCTNLLGSYKCSCKHGYQLLPDQKTCIGMGLNLKTLLVFTKVMLMSNMADVINLETVPLIVGCFHELLKS